MGAKARMPVQREDLSGGRFRRAPGGAEVGAGARLRMGLSDLFTCAAAASGGHLEVLQWACECDCPWDEGTFEAAAYGGHLEVLRWMREHDCPWDEATCAAAADGGNPQGGNLAALQW